MENQQMPTLSVYKEKGTYGKRVGSILDSWLKYRGTDDEIINRAHEFRSEECNEVLVELRKTQV